MRNKGYAWSEDGEFIDTDELFNLYAIDKWGYVEILGKQVAVVDILLSRNELEPVYEQHYNAWYEDQLAKEVFFDFDPSEDGVLLGWPLYPEDMITEATAWEVV